MRFPLPAASRLPLLLVLAAACSSVVEAPAGTGDAGTEVGTDGSGEATGDGSDEGQEGQDEGMFDPTADAGAGDRPCDPWAQDCPDGEKCTHWFDGYQASTRCVPVAPDPRQPGEPCHVEDGALSGLDNCALGSICHYVNEQGVGSCVELCGGSPEEPTCSDPQAMCELCGEGCPAMCLIACDPLAPECDDGQVCAPNNGGGFACTNAGAPDGTGGYGGVCEFANDCDAGFACVPADLLPSCDGKYCCTTWCDLEAVEPCPPELVCKAWDPNQADEEYADVGVCALP